MAESERPLGDAKRHLVAIVGGSGLAQFEGLELTRREVMRTPYGEPSGALSWGCLHAGSSRQEVVFLPRHGYSHTIPPHDINYRANLWALNEVGVTSVIAVASVGGIRSDLVPGRLVVPDQILDYTYGRSSTFFDNAELPVTHVDFTHPYDASLRQCLLQAGQRVGAVIADGGVYACVQGPRLETAAEINRYERDGADMVGMTGMPEAVLARELGMRYACLSVVVNLAAGRAPAASVISLDAIMVVLNTTMVTVRAILAEALKVCDEQGFEEAT